MTNTYQGGYRKALLDVLDWFTEHSETASYYKMNESNFRQILKLMNKDFEMMMNGEFEVFIAREEGKKKILRVTTKYPLKTKKQISTNPSRGGSTAIFKEDK